MTRLIVSLACAAAMVLPATAAERHLLAQTQWAAPPASPSFKEGLAPLPGVRLWYTDTGGPGEAVVLLHANTGSYDTWAYQRPVLVKAGYRVITYSRRGHLKSDPVDAMAPGSSTEDLAALLDYLGVKRAHLVGTAGGGLVPPDFALTYPQRTLSIVIASSIAGISDPDYLVMQNRVINPAFLALPNAMQELGPSYRAANPDGVAAWEALAHAGWGGGAVRQLPNKPLTYATFAKVKAPVMLLTGDADLVMPPSRMRALHAKAPPGAELVTIAEAGHSVWWEQPQAFNAAVLDFIRRHPAKR